jgi:hypothetical protein
MYITGDFMEWFDMFFIILISVFSLELLFSGLSLYFGTFEKFNLFIMNSEIRLDSSIKKVLNKNYEKTTKLIALERILFSFVLISLIILLDISGNTISDSVKIVESYGVAILGLASKMFKKYKIKRILNVDSE